MKNHFLLRSASSPYWFRSALLLGVSVIMVLLAALSAAGTPAVTQAQGQARVRCDPAVVVAPVGQPVNVDIYVENIENLYGADVRLSFDTAIAQIVDTDPNASGIQIQILDDFLSPDFVLRKNGDNVAGTIWYAVSQVNPSVAVSGSGPLARVTFQPQKVGSFVMPITYHEFATGNGFEIDVEPIDCQVTFYEVTSDLLIYLPTVIKE